MSSAELDPEDDHDLRLVPFTHIRCLGTYEEYTGNDTGYRAFLVFVYDGRAAVARLPLVLPDRAGSTWERLDDTVRRLLDLLSQLDIDQRLEFHSTIDETMDVYFTVDQMLGSSRRR